MNMVSRLLPVLFLLVASPVMAETTTATPTTPVSQATPAKAVTPPASVRPTPAAAASATGTTKPAVTAIGAVAPTSAAKPTPAPQTTQPPAASPVFENILNTTPVITPEQRRQKEMLANAERVDKANRELLARNQELQLQMENLSIQNNVLKRDRSNEGIWNGAGAVILGFLMGWFFSGVGRRKSSW